MASLELLVVPGVELALALLGAVERRERDVDVAGLEERAEVAVDEREQQRPDVGAVDVGVRHQDDLVVAELLVVELVGLGGEPDAERGDDVLDLLVVEDLVEPGLLDVQDLAAQREDGLEVAVARLLRRAAGRVALDEVELATRPGPCDAQSASLPGRPPPPKALLRWTSSRPRRAAVAGLRAQDHLLDDRLGLARVVLQPLGQLLPRRGSRRRPATSPLPSLVLVCPSNCGSCTFTLKHGREALAEVVAGEVDLGLLEQAVVVRVVLERARERAAEAGDVRPALVRVDVVDEREDVLLVARVVAHRERDGHLAVLVLDVDGVLEERLAAPRRGRPRTRRGRPRSGTSRCGARRRPRARRRA